MPAFDGGACFQGVRRESAAFRLMKQMGWEEGTGLGKDKQGMKKHLNVKKKDDTLGVGANLAADKWSYNTREFDDLLKNLKVQAAANPKEIQSEDSDTDGEVEVKVEVKAEKACRPQGRYNRIERSKMVKNYSQTDLDAILGSRVSDKAAVAKQSSDKVPELPAENADGESTRCGDLHTMPSGWWGVKLGFVKAGCLGSSLSITSERKAFSENDQEQLYNSVQNKATSGKGGLGIADRPKKIGGAHWKGQKVQFEDQEADDAPEEQPKREKRKREESGSSEFRIKWKKLCKDFLEQAPQQRTSLRKLQKHVAAAVGTDCFSDLESLKRKLSRSSRFVIDGEKIRLASCEA